MLCDVGLCSIRLWVMWKGPLDFVNFRPCLPFVHINYFWSCYLLSIMKNFPFHRFWRFEDKQQILNRMSAIWFACITVFSFLCLGIALLWDSSLWCLYMSENAMNQFLLLICIRQKRTKRDRHCFWNKGLYTSQSWSRRSAWIIRNRWPTFPSLYIYILLVSLVRVEFHSLGLGSWPPSLGLESGLATVYINKVSA